VGSIPHINVENVGVNNVGIQRIGVPNIYYYTPHTQTVPFILNIGAPVVDMPGCVEFHPDAAENRENPNLKEDDSSNTRVLCDGQYPSYDALDYTPEDLNIYVETPPPAIKPPPDPPGTPEIEPPNIPNTETECPAPNQPRVGDLTQDGSEKVIGHELQGTTCVVLYEDTTAIEKYLPTSNQVSTTASIAVVATAAAAATPLLLRVVKPVIKKLWTTIQKKLGKTPTRLSRNDVIANEYRKKKGLPPFKVQEYR
tara:strand:+ start:10093 stop:10854 length:762 start_codon:yes stop_codon:yes gene_type:complete